MLSTANDGMPLVSHTICVAPMLDWTDRHCRYFHRLLSPRARLYSEMVTTGALLHGDVDRHLRFDPAEHPVALQLGGSDPDALARCAALASDYGYDEINLNCGCPSPRVQRGSFGACLMDEPALVRDCVIAMQAAAPSLLITVKHRLGIDDVEDFAFAHRFVSVVQESGIGTFIVHARNAWLQGLSPKENREVPPLRHDWVRRLKLEFPTLRFVINGGIATAEAIRHQLTQVDGVMIGREAYHHPYALALWDAEFLAPGRDGESLPTLPARADIVHAMTEYAHRELAVNGVPLRSISRHMLGLYNGLPGARAFRRALSDSATLSRVGPDLLLQALQHVERAEDDGETPVSADGDARQYAVSLDD
ncbi:tRNA dihydrouridine(20/20a) synthase DusA [soil metagenome]